MAVSLKLVCVLVLCMLVVETSALQCTDVAKQMSSCITYLQNGGMLPPKCCDGVKALNGMAKTTPDRQTACRCLQTAAKTIKGIKPNLAEGLPGKCGVSIPYKISTSTNCNNVK